MGQNHGGKTTGCALEYIDIRYSLLWDGVKSIHAYQSREEVAERDTQARERERDTFYASFQGSTFVGIYSALEVLGLPHLLRLSLSLSLLLSCPRRRIIVRSRIRAHVGSDRSHPYARGARLEKEKGKRLERYRKIGRLGFPRLKPRLRAIVGWDAQIFAFFVRNSKGLCVAVFALNSWLFPYFFFSFAFLSSLLYSGVNGFYCGTLYSLLKGS